MHFQNVILDMRMMFKVKHVIHVVNILIKKNLAPIFAQKGSKLVDFELITMSQPNLSQKIVVKIKNGALLLSRDCLILKSDNISLRSSSGH